MSKPTISSYLRDHLDDIGKKKEPGPYITISRQWGCGGYELGQLLTDKLNQRDEEGRWRLYYKELLKQLAEDTGDLVFLDTGAVVFDDYAVGIVLFVDYLDVDFREDAGLFAGIERVIDGFLGGGEQRLCGGIETQQVAILQEEFRYGDLPLSTSHFTGGQVC